MAPSHKPPDLVGDLMRKVRSLAETATDVAQSSRNAIGFAADLVAIRGQLAAVRDVLQMQTRAQKDAVVSAAWALYHEHPEMLRAESRTGVLRAWTRLLIDATEKVEHDEHWASRYAEEQSPDEEQLVAAASRSSSAAFRDL